MCEVHKFPKRRCAINSSMMAVSKEDMNITTYDEFETSSDISDSNEDTQTHVDTPSSITCERRRSKIREVAIAHPLLSYITCMCTDQKGPFYVASLSEEINYQSFIEKSTKYLYQYFFKKKSEASTISSTSLK